MGEDDKAFDGGKPMVFTFTDTFACEANQIDVLKSFMKQFVKTESLPIDLYPLTRLFYALCKELSIRGCVDDVTMGPYGPYAIWHCDEKICETFLANDPYEWRAGISCSVGFLPFFYPSSDFLFEKNNNNIYI